MGAGLATNAVGVAGMALVLARCFAPILRLTAALLMLRREKRLGLKAE